MHKGPMAMEDLAALIMLQLEKGGLAHLTVTGHSMLPMLHHQRDAVNLIPTSGKQKVGDVVLYRRENGQYVLHRIIRATDTGYICCGDNQYMREAVTQAQLLAKVESFRRGGRHYPLSHPGYRLYTAVWVKLFPLRRGYIVIRRYLGRLRRKNALARKR